MIRALYSSAAGMQAQQLNLDVISNNLANVNTTGFKKTKNEFQDLLYQTTRAAGAEQGGGNVVRPACKSAMALNSLPPPRFLQPAN
jgi:flagellar basal-body rod protein FlgG